MIKSGRQAGCGAGRHVAVDGGSTGCPSTGRGTFLRELETVLRIHTDTGGGAISTDADAVEPLARRLREPLSGAELLERYRGVTGRVRVIYAILPRGRPGG